MIAHHCLIDLLRVAAIMVEFIDKEQFELLRNEERVLVATMHPSTKEDCTHVIFHVEGPEEYKEPMYQPGDVKTTLIADILADKARENRVSLIHKRVITS